MEGLGKVEEELLLGELGAGLGDGKARGGDGVTTNVDLENFEKKKIRQIEMHELICLLKSLLFFRNFLGQRWW